MTEKLQVFRGSDLMDLGRALGEYDEARNPKPLDVERIAAAYLFAMANGWFDDVHIEELFDEEGMTPEDRWRRYSSVVAGRIVEADRVLSKVPA